MQRNGKLPHPTATILEMPAANLKTPAANLEVSAANLETPATNLEVSAANLETPATNLEVSAANLEASARPRKRHRSAYQVKDSIEQRLMLAKVAIEAVLNDPKLQDMLTPYGYTPTEMRQGQALRAQALALVQQRHASVGKQFAATDSRTKLQAQAHVIYRRHVALARLALRGDRDATQTLDLSARKGTLAGWVLQAQQFYTNALADQAILAKLARYGATKEQMLAAQALVEAVANGIVAQQSRKGIAKESKQARDVALQALDRWMLDFLAVARIALADQPQRLAQMGLAGK